MVSTRSGSRSAASSGATPNGRRASTDRVRRRSDAAASIGTMIALRTAADGRWNGPACARWLALALSVTCAGLAGAAAQDDAAPLRAEQVRGIEHFAGTDAQRALLLQQRFVVVDGGTAGGLLR